MDRITAILSGYKRIYTIEEQVEAIRAQTYPEIDILVWINLADGIGIEDYPTKILDSCNIIASALNFGVWGRFSQALMSPNPYVWIVDDDTIPGPKWAEECMKFSKHTPSVISTRGVLMNKDKDQNYPSPDSYKAIGWCNQNEEVQQVDFGCHSWFFHRDILRIFWSTAPLPFPMNFGEDMHLSYAASKLGINTFILPHPKDNLDVWGSKADTAQKYGEDPAAISWNPNANKGMNYYWNSIRNDGGYQIVQEKICNNASDNV